MPTAAELDASDPLAPFLDRFAPAPSGLTYLDGNSLGRLAADTPAAPGQTVHTDSTTVCFYKLAAAAVALAHEIPGVGIGSPTDPAIRGSHVALTHSDTRAPTQQLIAHDVIVDYREPDVIRFGLSPLTTRFADVQSGLEMLRRVASAGVA